MGYSELTKKLMPAYSGNYTAGRLATISEITIHHTGDAISLEQLGKLWQTKGRNGSSHYGIKDNDIYCYVSEGDTAWTNSNWASNCRAITIETCNSAEGGNWPVSDASIETLINLVADIARRHNLGKLKVGENLTYHSMYTATVCPGPFLRSKLRYIAERANALNERTTTDKQTDHSAGCENCAALQAEVDRLLSDNAVLTEENARLTEQNTKLNNILNDIENLVKEKIK